MTMPARSAKRNRGDLEKTFNDDSSGVRKSGASCKLADSGKATDSSMNNLDVVNSAKRKGGGKAKKGTDGMDLGENSSTPRVKKAKTSGVDRGDIQREKADKGLNGAAGISHSNENIVGKSRSSIRYDKKVIEQACKRLREGALCRIVADELGVDEKTVRGWRCRYIPEAERKELNAKRLNESISMPEECKLLMKQGAKTSFLAKRFGVKANTIATWRSRFAPETQRDLYDKHTILETCRKLKEAGLEEVALRTGINRKTLASWQKQYLSTKIKETTSEGNWEYNKYTKFEVCDRLRQGQIPETVAAELDVHISVLLKWKSENPVEIVTQPEDEEKYDKNFILDVCNRLVKGETGQSIARSLGIAVNQVYVWRQKYCTSEQHKPSDKHKFDKETIRQACELVKSGENNLTIAKKLNVPACTIAYWKKKRYIHDSYVKSVEFHSFDKILKLLKNAHYRTRRNVLEAHKLLKQGQSSKTVAAKLKVDPALISNWRLTYMAKEEGFKDTAEYPDDIVQRVYEGFKRGDSLQAVSRESGIIKRTVNHWHCQYLERVSSNYLQKMSSIDEKLKSEPLVVLTKDQKIEQLGQMHSLGRRTKRKNSPDDGATIDQACNPVEECSKN